MNDHDVHEPDGPDRFLEAHERPGLSGSEARESDPTAPTPEAYKQPDDALVATPDEIAQDEIVDRSQTPEAIEAAKVAGGSSPERALDPHVRARGVEWVRPTDLMARQGAQMAGRGIDFQAAMALRTRQKALDGVRSLGERAKRLPPLYAFGRGTARSGPARSAVGAS
ncbi:MULTISPECIES: hypothetical protein [Micrococcales]|jgi:hypothetical protein|uniref:Uncharacterized protein n=2 Tax=Micrococcales TaxID=85006 RepID=A0AAJ6APL1_MICMQ|nr:MULTISPECIES: hypothetical protein [Micrococcales]EXJ50881.1 hypothetical protein AS96_12425 [Microbacterium sp. MRS-1]MDR6268471.1 hypothetical protein [Arthrobacter russicus]WEF20831.1 hypothetical protein PWF71_16305 [Microbacterium liquefaciens]